MDTGVTTLPGQEASPQQQGELVIPVDLEIYNIDVVQSTVYRFAKDGGYLGGIEANQRTVTVCFSNAFGPEKRETLRINFLQELTDQFLRARIRQETEDVRNLILAHAFSDSTLAQE
jgi:His-Xaa-Ser system protein HxsD